MEIICCPSYWDGWRQCVADGASGALASLSVALNLLGQDSQVSTLFAVMIIIYTLVGMNAIFNVNMGVAWRGSKTAAVSIILTF